MFCYNRKLWEKSQIANEKDKMRSQLSHRLSVALEHALPGKEFWDICCDHGILGIHALRSQNFLEVNFVDQVPEIMQRLEEKIRKYIKKSDSPAEKLSFYTCPAELLQAKLKGNICVLGVGAEKINFIMQEWSRLGLLHADRLILGPHKDTEWFCEKVIPHFQRYHLVKKIDLLEKNRTRTILVLDKLL